MHSRRLACLVACVLLGAAAAVQTTQNSTVPNQQTVAKASPIAPDGSQPEGPFASLPLSLVTPAALGPLYPIYAWQLAMDEYFPLLEPPIQIRARAITAFAYWDAASAYDPKAVCIYLDTNKYRRPVLEHNDVNRNIALSYCIYKVLVFLMPVGKTKFLDTLTKTLALEASDSLDPTTAIGIGNLAALGVIDFHSADGFNQLGTDGAGYTNGNPYTAWNYSDPRPLPQRYTPVNGPYTLTNASRWQPNVIELPGVIQSTGAPYVQHHITPHIGNAKTVVYKGKLPTLPQPSASQTPGSPAYKAQIDEVLKYSAELTDLTKMQAEHFERKGNSLGTPTLYTSIFQGNIHLTQQLFILLVQELALYDANTAAWGAKVYFDAVRPITAIRYVYGNTKIVAWGGPKRGAQNITGNQYRSYLKTMQHADYPSGSACYCGAFTEALKAAYGTDKMDFTIIYPAGSSLIEAGTPKEDINLYWATWDDYADQCAWSRVVGGVHFVPATKAGRLLCEPIGRAAHVRAKALKEGVNELVDISSYL